MRRFVSPGRGFILLYALAYAGVFVSFMPFVMVLLPLKAAQAGGGHAVQLLSAGALGGAAVASIANIVFGALSDRTRRLRGTRRPWVTVGLGVLSASYGLLLVAADPVSLLLAVACIQIGVNMMFAPIAAVMADEIPDAQKGMVAGLTGVSHPIGAMAAVLITLPGLGGDATRYALLCLLFVALTTPFLLLAREGAAVPPPPPAPQRELRRFDFLLAWASRILFQVAGNGLSTYGFYYFLSVLDREDISKTSVEANPIVATMTGSTLSLIHI